MTARHLALLVRELRKAQRSGGKGYKSKTDHDKATHWEHKVDDAVSHILDGTHWPHIWPFNEPFHEPK